MDSRQQYEVQVPVQEIHLLIVGKSGTGKTSLASALLANESATGSFRRESEDVNLVYKQGRLEPEGIPVHLYDTRGICDVSVSNEEIMESIQRNCRLDQLNAVIVCMRFDERLDESNKEVFQCIHNLDPDLWSKTVFALTFCDHLPPGLKRKSNNEKRIAISETWRNWVTAIKQELSSLGVSYSVIESIRIAPTTHIDEDFSKECFSNIQLPWLTNLWLTIGYRREDKSKSNVIVSPKFKLLMVGAVIIIIILSFPLLGFL